ncbi:hypothetical protein DL93DRAFT_2095510 [Clavulina sp. PMI_390]|nr:hypothetical protein DL93DRAFT_2095510 [Clavulina sp. PMI_390]
MPPPSTGIETGPSLYCWIVTIDHLPPTSAFQLFYDCLDPASQEKLLRLNKTSTQMDVAGCMIGRLIPHIIMNQRGVPPGAWTIRGNEDGQKPHLIAPTIEKAIGFSASRSEQVVSFAFALGREDRVAQVGCDIRRIHLSKHIPLDVYIDSISHKLCDMEREGLREDPAEGVTRDRVLGRVFILWTLKEALMKAIGQPLRSGFDWRRVCFDVASERVWLDEQPMWGWEFKLFVARVSHSGRLQNKTYQYQVACAIHRGGNANKFTWNDRGDRMDEWLRFLNVDTLVERVWNLGYPTMNNALTMRQAEEKAAAASGVSASTTTSTINVGAAGPTTYASPPSRNSGSEREGRESASWPRASSTQPTSKNSTPIKNIPRVSPTPPIIPVIPTSSSSSSSRRTREDYDYPQYSSSVPPITTTTGNLPPHLIPPRAAAAAQAYAAGGHSTPTRPSMSRSAVTGSAATATGGTGRPK